MQEKSQKNFKIYRSSAGSGKTFALVKEYLKILLLTRSNLYFRHVCAITFTNKAANEMKKRILDSLHDFAKHASKGEQKDMALAILDETKLSEEEFQEKSSEILQQILHNYSDFRIGTIDKFLYRLIRSYSFELDIPFDSEVETDTEPLIDAAVERLFLQAKEDEVLSNFLYDFIKTNAEFERSWRIKSQVKEFANNLFKEESVLHQKSIIIKDLKDFIELKNDLYKRLKSSENRIKEQAQKVEAILQEKQLSEVDFTGKSGSFIFFPSKLLKNSNQDFTKTHQKTFEANEWAHKDSSNGDIIEGFRAQVSTSIEQILEHLRRKNDIKLILRNIHNLALYHKLKVLINEIKLEMRILHISEFNEKISLLLQEEQVSFVYERLGESINHYLIDEFQDTSKLQFFNLLPLIENSLAKAQLNMVVGDAKQSIYRFRNGDMMQFVNLPKIYNPWSQKLVSSYRIFEEAKDEIPLKNNYRSKTELVEFNNEFYEYLKSFLNPENQKVFEEHKQIPKKGTGGFVQIDVYPSKSLDKPKEQILDKAMIQLKKCLDDGYQEQDICFLVRSKTQALDIAARLDEESFEFVTEDSFKLLNNDRVSCILNFLRQLDKSSELRYKTEFYRYLGKCDQDFEWQEAIRKLLEDKSKFYDFLLEYGFEIDPVFLRKLNRNSQLFELARSLKFQFQEDSALGQFSELCRKFDRDSRYHKLEFFHYLEKREKSMKMKISDNPRAVKIETIHKSKGLEYPIVIMPFTAWENKSSGNFQWTDESSKLLGLEKALIQVSKTEKTSFESLKAEADDEWLIDSINLLYVATTRAIDRLYIASYWHNNSGTYKYIAAALAKFNSWDPEKGQIQIGLETSVTRNLDPNQTQGSHLMVEPGASIYNSFEFGVAKGNIFIQDWSNPRIKGEILHQLIASASQLIEIEAKTKQLADYYLWPAAQREEALAKIRQIQKSEGLSEFFNDQNNLLIEREFYDEQGEIFRPDRLLVKGDSVSILDFKSGEQREQDKKQVKAYASALNELGYKTDALFLYYFNDESIVSC